MRVSLKSVSLVFLATLLAQTASAQGAFDFGDEGRTLRAAVSIERGGTGVSGICLMKRTEDGSVVGSVVNEFGIKAFDFTLDGKSKKLNLANVIGFLDKRLVRRELRIDLRFLLTAELSPEGKAEEKKKRTVETAGDTVILRNLRRNLTYTFIPLKEDNESTPEHEIER